MRVIFLLAMAFILGGCFTSNRQESIATVETRQGVEGGQPTNIVIKRQERTDSQAQSGVDVGAAVQAAMAGFRGDFLGALDKLKPPSFSPLESKLDSITASLTKPGETPFPTGEIAGGAAAAVAALLALLKHREANTARRESDEAWSVKERALAALPPEEAKKLLV
jgi:hypothetical protein